MRAIGGWGGAQQGAPWLLCPALLLNNCMATTKQPLSAQGVSGHPRLTSDTLRGSLEVPGWLILPGGPGVN